MQIAVGSIRSADVQGELRKAKESSLIKFIENFSLTEYNIIRHKTVKKVPAAPSVQEQVPVPVPAVQVPQAPVPAAPVPQAPVPAAPVPSAPVKKIRQKINIR